MRYAPALVLLLALTGCGSATGSVQPGSSPTSSAAPSTPPVSQPTFSPTELTTATARPSGNLGTAQAVRWTKPAQVDGRTVTIGFASGVCGEARWVDVKEAAASVTLTLYIAPIEPPPDQVCPALAVILDARVTLEAPLGSRTLIDGACQLANAAGDGQCPKS